MVATRWRNDGLDATPPTRPRLPYLLQVFDIMFPAPQDKTRLRMLNRQSIRHK